MEIKYYELECGVKANEDEEYGCEICRGLVDTEYSIVIKADHYPTFEEAEEFINSHIVIMYFVIHHPCYCPIPLFFIM